MSILWPTGTYETPAGQRFRNLDSDRGLSQNNVWGVVQDKRGLIWIATSFGLNRFDGYNTRIMLEDPGNPGGMVNHKLRSIFMDRGSRIWLGSSSGVSVFTPETGVFDHIGVMSNANPSGLSSSFIPCIAQLGDEVWIGTGAGIDVIDENLKVVRRIKQNSDQKGGLNNSRIRALAPGSDGRMWVATSKGVNRYDPETGTAEYWVHNENDPATISHNTIRSLALDRRGSLWAGTDNGVSRIDVETGAVTRYLVAPGDEPGNRINAIIADSTGTIWIGSMGKGLFQLDPETGKIRVHKRHGQHEWEISGEDIISLFLDHSELLWIGTYGNGVSMLDLAPAKFSIFDLGPDQEGNTTSPRDIHSLLQDDEGVLWVGTSQGLLKHDPDEGGFTHYRGVADDPTTLRENHIEDIAYHENQIWVATYSGGVSRLWSNGKGFDHFYQLPKPGRQITGTEDNLFFKLLTGPEGELWAGTYRGLERFDQKAEGFKVHEPTKVWKEEISGRRIQEIYLDRKGNLWIGTDYNGIFKITALEKDPTPARSAKANTRLPRRINTITSDPMDRIWACTA
jgi:ligand-binding sensor domain-containing protein